MSNPSQSVDKSDAQVQPAVTNGIAHSTSHPSISDGEHAAGYADMQSAPRFPIKLPVSLKSGAGESLAETENISANGVLFQVDSEMPVGSLVDFSISLPAAIVGAVADVRVDCRGRVVRSFAEDGRRGVGVVIDEYHFERR